MRTFIFCFSLLLIFIEFSSFAKTSCLKNYEVNSPHVDSSQNNFSRFDTLSNVGRILEITEPEWQLALATFSDKSIAEVKEQYSESIKRQENIELSLIDFDKERFRNMVQVLNKTGFLFGPFHEFLFLKNINLFRPQQSRLSPIDYYKQKGVLRKNEFEATSKAIFGNGKNDENYRKTLSKAMASEFTSSYPPSHLNWQNLDSKAKFEAVKLLKYSSHLKELTVSQLDAFFEIRSSNEGLHYLEKIFELTLPEIHKLAHSRAQGITGATLNKLGPPLLAGTSFVTGLHALDPNWWWYFTHHIEASMNVSSLGAVYIPMASLLLPFNQYVRRIPNIPGATSAKLQQIWHRWQVNHISSKRIEKEITANELDQKKRESSEEPISLEEKKDILFNEIKKDLNTNKLESLTEIYTYGNALAAAIANLLERLPLVMQKFSTFQTELNNIQTSLKNQNLDEFSLQKIGKNFDFMGPDLINLTLELGVIKSDLLALSVAFDRFRVDSRLISLTSLATSTEKSILENKFEQLQQINKQILFAADVIKTQEISISSSFSFLTELQEVLNTNSLFKTVHALQSKEKN